MGYGGSQRDTTHRLGRTGDGGVDGLIKQDLLGLDAIYIQAKRWSGPVARPVVQAFLGSFEGHHAAKGVTMNNASIAFGRDILDGRDPVTRSLPPRLGHRPRHHEVDGCGGRVAPRR